MTVGWSIKAQISIKTRDFASTVSTSRLISASHTAGVDLTTMEAASIIEWDVAPSTLATSSSIGVKILTSIRQHGTPLTTFIHKSSRVTIPAAILVSSHSGVELTLKAIGYGSIPAVKALLSVRVKGPAATAFFTERGVASLWSSACRVR